MTFLLAALGSIVIGVAELSVVPHLIILGARPHPVLVMVVLVTSWYGIEPGLLAAFSGGLGLDVLTGRPIGASSFALLVCAALAAMLGAAGARLRGAITVVAVFPLSLVFSLILFGVFGMLRTPVPAQDPVGLLVPGAAFDLVIAAVLWPLLTLVRRRRGVEAKVSW